MSAFFSGIARKAIHRIACDPAYRRWFFWLPDALMCRLAWFDQFGTRLDLRNPRGFNEKLQWLMVHDVNPEHGRRADKVRAREWVAEKIGEEHLVPLLGVWRNADDVDFASLPDRFVLKCNHNSGGGMYICRDKSGMDVDAVREGLRRALKKNHYHEHRERVYKNIKPLVLAEKFLEDPSTPDGGLVNYKFFCFSGTPKFLYVMTYAGSSAGKGHPKITIRDMDWNVMPFRLSGYESLPFDREKPAAFEEMVEIARRLSEDELFLRVDLYCVDGKVYFSEATFYPTGGMGVFEPPEWEERIGSWLELPKAD